MEAQARIEVIPAALRRALRRAVLTALALALVLGGAGAAAALSGAEPPESVAAAATSSLWLSGSSLSYADAQEAAQLLGWEASAYSLPGVGISRSMSGAGTLLSTAQGLLPLEQAPDVVVLQGGEADNSAAGDPLHEAAARLIDHVRQSTSQGTRIVLVGPIPGAEVPDSLRLVNSVLAQVASDKGVAFVDAVAGGWHAGQPEVPKQLAAALAN